MDTVEQTGGGHRAGAEGAAPTVDVDRSDQRYRGWLKEAVRKVQADANRSRGHPPAALPAARNTGASTCT